MKIKSFLSKNMITGFAVVVFAGLSIYMLSSLNKKPTDKVEDNKNNSINNSIGKTDKPNVELFVMSHCPYGLQMEKGIMPAVNVLGDKINFKIKFTDYAMHGEKELKEQLNQYCIQEEQTEKYSAYLECFLRDGDSGVENCLNQSGIDKDKLSNCFAKTDKEYRVLQNFNNNSGFKGRYPGFEIFKADNKKYNVKGSPTLIINGVESQSTRDSNSLLKSICSAFKNAPAECSTQLSSDVPSTGFGGGVSSSGNASNSGCR